MRNSRILSVVAVLLLAMAWAASPSEAAQINVPGDYGTIAEAVAAATAGDTVVVAAGTYNLTSAITVNKPLRILGAQAGLDPRPTFGGRAGPETILQSTGTIFDINNTEGVEVNGFELRSASTSSSINVLQAVDVRNVRVLYNIVYNTNYPGGASNEGIKFRRCSAGAVVSYNYLHEIPAPGDPINFDSVMDGEISSNEIVNSGSENAGIYLYASERTLVFDNIVDTTIQNDGIKMGNKGGNDAAKTGGFIVGNTVRNTKQDGITVYMSNTLVEGNEVSGSTSENGGIYFAFALSNVTITGNRIHDNTFNTGKWGNPAGVMLKGDVLAATFLVSDNEIYNNYPNGVTNKSAAILDATNNWWGDASGPGGGAVDPVTGAVANGSGDVVSSNVHYDPWLIAPPGPTDTEGPLTSDIEAVPNPAQVGSFIFISAVIDDSNTGASNIASAEYSLDGGLTWTPMVPGYGAFDEVAEEVTATIPPFSAAGVYELLVRGTDAIGNVGPAEAILLAVYDPDAGFATGGGWIMSFPGACPSQPDIVGKATFGFVSKYHKGATVPTGNTEFQFKAAGFNFQSTSYDWLVIAGARAQYKGLGTINGVGGYGFMLTAIDGQVSGGGGIDRFRIKIWDAATGAIYYDNQIGDADSDEPTTAIGGGSIVIHTTVAKGK
jgi:parallel beta-helix repeat protein